MGGWDGQMGAAAAARLAGLGWLARRQLREPEGSCSCTHQQCPWQTRLWGFGQGRTAPAIWDASGRQRPAGWLTACAAPAAPALAPAALTWVAACVHVPHERAPDHQLAAYERGGWGGSVAHCTSPTLSPCGPQHQPAAAEPLSVPHNSSPPADPEGGGPLMDHSSARHPWVSLASAAPLPQALPQGRGGVVVVGMQPRAGPFPCH